MIKKLVPDSPKLCIYRKIKSDCVLCLLSSGFYFIDDKTYTDSLKDEITPSLKANDRLKFA